MTPSPTPPTPPWALAWRLATGQLLSWGILYYAFTALVDPMQADLGWSRPLLNGGLSIGLLTWGVLAFPVGAWIQRHGGRGVMTLGSVLGGLAFASLGVAGEPWHYLAAWIAIGASMACLLYEPAFAVVVAAFGPDYRRGIVVITLVGGLASTVFIPAAHLLAGAIGWRSTFAVLGGLLVIIGGPLHHFGLGSSVPARESGAPPVRLRESLTWLVRDARDRRFVALAALFTAHIAGFSGLIFLIIPVMSARGSHAGDLLAAIALIGPMQVLGRLLLVTRGRDISSLKIGWIAMSLLTASILVLLLAPRGLAGLVTFAVLFGAGNGVMTIVKGTAIAELFGRDRYAELSGALSAPAVIAKAASPLALSWLWTVSGSPEWPLVAILAVNATGLLALSFLKPRA